MSVLVVDSDQNFRQSLINLLLICGVENFEVASSGQKALEKISKTLFDVVLMNFFLNDTPGLQLAGEILKRKPDTRVIFFIEDDQQPFINSAGLTKLKIPLLLKSSVSRMLPQLLSEDF